MPGSRRGCMVFLALLVRQHAEHDHQKCPQTIEQQHVESIELNKDDHAHDENQQTNGRSRLNTSPVSVANPNHTPETDAQREDHTVHHDQSKNHPADMKPAATVMPDRGLSVLLREVGIDGPSALRRARLATDLLEHESTRLPVPDYFALIEAIKAEADDPALPLRMASAASPELFSPGGSTIDRVRAAIRECLPSGEVSIDAAAQRLRVGRRTPSRSPPPPRRRAPPQDRARGGRLRPCREFPRAQPPRDRGHGGLRQGGAA